MKYRMAVLLLAGATLVPMFAIGETLTEGQCVFSDDPNVVNDARCYEIREARSDVIQGGLTSGIIPGGPPPPPPSGQNPPPPAPGQWQPPISFPGSGGIDLYLNTVERIWNLLERAKPVVNLERPPYAAALPSGLEHWTDLEKWAPPRSVAVHFSAKNVFNIQVGVFDYVISYLHSGSYQGKGKYLMNITVYAANASAKPGFNLDAKAEIPSVYNSGTKEEPLAAAQVLVTATLKSLMSNITQTRSYAILGDGKFSETVPMTLKKFAPRNWK